MIARGIIVEEYEWWTSKKKAEKYIKTFERYNIEGRYLVEKKAFTKADYNYIKKMSDFLQNNK